MRTGSDFERRSVQAYEHLATYLAPLLARPRDEVTFDETDAIVQHVVDIPLVALLGAADGPDILFELIAWNEANALAEGMSTPYLAARSVLSVEIFEPLDRFGLVAPLSELTERYEDDPDSREATRAEITAVLDDFRARAPWPVTT